MEILPEYRNAHHPSEEHVCAAVHAIHPHALLFDPSERAVSSARGYFGFVRSLVGEHRDLSGVFIDSQIVGFAVVVDVCEAGLCSVLAN